MLSIRSDFPERTESRSLCRKCRWVEKRSKSERCFGLLDSAVGGAILTGNGCIGMLEKYRVYSRRYSSHSFQLCKSQNRSRDRNLVSLILLQNASYFIRILLLVLLIAPLLLLVSRLLLLHCPSRRSMCAHEE
jgi:hypothetical protein